MTRILVTRPGVLNQRDRAALRRAGVVTIEAERPADVKLIEADGAEVSGGDMLFAAMKGLNLSGAISERAAFVKALHDLMNDARQRNATPTPEQSHSLRENGQQEEGHG
jgi:hypothetical protein